MTPALVDSGMWRLLLLALWLSLGACKGRSEQPAAVQEQPPYDYGALPEFALTGHDGKSLGTKELSGKVWVANAFFTSCRSICPPLMEKVSGLTKRLSDDELRFVSITVDPDNDELPILAAHARSLRAVPRWTLARTNWGATHALVEGGFHTAMGKRKPGGDNTDITHSGKLFLVDRKGHVRGYFSTDAEGLDSLERETKWLLNE